MTIALVIRIPGITTDDYDRVMHELGLPLHADSPNWPPEVISHLAGTDENGLVAIDIWDSRQAFDTFQETRLGPAFEKAGIKVQPQITQVNLHNTYVSGRAH